jgi:outer membrane protein OmpA-like peptidoglycan-associated protein
VGYRLDKQAEELAKIAETRRTEEGIITSMRDNILFDVNSSVIKPQAVQNIVKIADVLKKYPEDRIIVVGHTDDRGSAQFNERLSLQRAQAVKLQLVSSGVPESGIEALGQGESQPLAPNTSDQNRAKNRRVELQITVDQSKVQ